VDQPLDLKGAYDCNGSVPVFATEIRQTAVCRTPEFRSPETGTCCLAVSCGDGLSDSEARPQNCPTMGWYFCVALASSVSLSVSSVWSSKIMIKAISGIIAVAMLAASAFAQTANQPAVDHSSMDHAAHLKMMQQAQREADVATRGKDVMPFSLEATTHHFSKSTHGGVQQVVAKDAKDSAQISLIRSHLKQIRGQFLKGEFSGPAHIHGQDMPGLAELKQAKPGQISIEYKDMKAGGQLTYRTADPRLVGALHKWFDAQLSDHGKDAKEGHAHDGK
jgi:hypothetical protein